MPADATKFINQREGLDAEFNELGQKPARLLLSIDEFGKDAESSGRPILIGVKHMGGAV